MASFLLFHLNAKFFIAIAKIKQITSTISLQKKKKKRDIWGFQLKLELFTPEKKKTIIAKTIT